MPSKIVKECSRLIAQKGFKIAFIESATAGRMCAEFSLCKESGDILRGGISCYEVFVKEAVLKVPKRLIELYTPESYEVTESLATHGAELFKTGITIAITGLTTPGGSESAQKPVGTMFIALVINGRLFSQKAVFKGTPNRIVLKAIDTAAILTIQHID